ncbi:hypothetical protein Tco_1202970 [Tanacetum coccineum]
MVPVTPTSSVSKRSWGLAVAVSGAVSKAVGVVQLGRISEEGKLNVLKPRRIADSINRQMNKLTLKTDGKCWIIYTPT